MHMFPLNIQQKVEVIDPSISHYLRREGSINDLKKWLARVDFETCELFLIPYHQEYGFQIS